MATRGLRLRLRSVHAVFFYRGHLSRGDFSGRRQKYFARGYYFSRGPRGIPPRRVLPEDFSRRWPSAKRLAEGYNCLAEGWVPSGKQLIPVVCGAIWEVRRQATLARIASPWEIGRAHV